MILCISLFSALILIVSNQHVHADESISVSSIGLDYSSIIQFKNDRGNDFNIKSVRIWLSEDNSFKSFKTENGWTGKFEVGGKVLVFTSQDSVKPGENVKFGIKTNSKNPTINWKVLDNNSETIQSAAVVTRQSDSSITEDMLQPDTETKRIAINDNSEFRFIPEKPTIGSDFRIVGKNFVPNQNVDLYIDNQLLKAIKIDADGRFVSTAMIPDNISAKRTDFTLVDSGGTEKNNSIRLRDAENRQMVEAVKISISHTQQSIQRGETLTIKGNATPDTTLTLTSQDDNGKVLSINTISSGFDGKWSHEHVFPIDLKLGKMTMTVTDGKSTAVRGFEIISSQLINISSGQMSYEIGDTIAFSGTAISNSAISFILEDPIGTEVFTRTMSVDSSGIISFDIETTGGFLEGTYVLHAFQGTESAISVVGIGEQPEQVLLVNSNKLNYGVGSSIELKIIGQPHASVSLFIIDESDKTKINQTIELDDNGNYVFSVESGDLGTGAFTVEIRHGNSRGTTMFTIGLATGSGPIEFQTTKSEYSVGDRILVIGKTGNNSILNVIISDPDGTVVRTFETFSDSTGVFKVDNFRIPSNGKIGQWKIEVSSGENVFDRGFIVGSGSDIISLRLDKSDGMYSSGQIMTITGSDAVVGKTVTITITDSLGTEIDTLLIYPKADGEFYTIWVIPNGLQLGMYEISVSDTISESLIEFSIN